VVACFNSWDQFFLLFLKVSKPLSSYLLFRFRAYILGLGLGVTFKGEVYGLHLEFMFKG